jgi:chromosomal replication initiation ATPase DnaA
VTIGREQIALPLDWPQSQGESRLIVTDSNRAAFEHFRKWSLWPVKATLLTGPRRSGRSLLARTFAERVGGRVIDRADHAEEEELFHAWNAAQETGRPVIMVVDRVPPEWEIALPDLKTRIAVTPVARIAEPDDPLFQALVELHFADRYCSYQNPAKSYGLVGKNLRARKKY